MGNRLIDEAIARERARAEWEAEQQRLLDEVQAEEEEAVDETSKPKTRRKRKVAA
ncbi:hypothetical protein [Aeromicrobium sp. 179-A 4D2 NHS]|uniref:hypothetical protein n=1 Tax=Aeromicrobium sp. 179-A 4D2 NHS TaxID=3142375 RepID=UPI0039A2A55A